MKNQHHSAVDTQQRLLRAAGEVFARCGFRAATVREISRRAQANVAAVNYHFGDKRGLYSAVLKHTLSTALQQFPPDLGTTAGATREERLHAFVRSLLYRMLHEGRPAWHGKLMARELVDPTAALDQVVEEAIQPLYERLIRIVEEFVGKGATKELVRYCTVSIIGQCLVYRHAKPVLSRLQLEELSCPDIERVADHITQFSIVALEEFAKEGTAE